MTGETMPNPSTLEAETPRAGGIRRALPPDPPADAWASQEQKVSLCCWAAGKRMPECDLVRLLRAEVAYLRELEADFRKRLTASSECYHELELAYQRLKDERAAT